MALEIYEASAGTGKTYRITVTYLSIALGTVDSFNPKAFTRILGVTFTNKATEEMKRRILDTLRSLAAGQPSSYLDDLEQVTGLSKAVICQRAGIVQSHILHQYARFAITTLDAFFQRVIRAFVMEAGLSPGYMVDLDGDALLENTATGLLDSVRENAPLKHVLQDLLAENVNQSKSWDLTGTLVQVGKIVTDESFRLFDRSLINQLSDPAFMKSYMGDLRACVSTFEQKMRDLGRQGQQRLSETGLSPDDFPGRRRSFVHYFWKIANPMAKGKDFQPSKSFLDAYNGADSAWVPKKPSPQLLAARSALEPLVQELGAYYEAQWSLYLSSKLVLDILPQLEVQNDFIKFMRALQAESNALNIQDSVYLLSQLIGDGNAPFVYEKIGASYTSFLLDEFQDTSLLQWINMRPLLAEGLSQGATSMIVGDLKQAIYRWRNSDWRILGQDVLRDPLLTPFQINSHVLNVNRRSRTAIVSFVNDLVGELLKDIAQSLRNTADSLPPVNPSRVEAVLSQVERAYHDFKEEPSPDLLGKACGYVQVQCFGQEKGEDEDEDEVSTEPSFSSRQEVLVALQCLLADLQARGYEPSDILILVRSGREGQDIMDYLLSYKRINPQDTTCYDLISSDSLRLSASPYVVFVIALLRLALFPSDPKNRYVLRHMDALLDQSGVADDQAFLLRLRTLPPTYAFEHIMERMQWAQRTEALPYLQELHNLMIAFSRNRNAGLYAFLRWWDKSGQDKALKSELASRAIRILTIHKAKGLQAPVVIMPFCDEKVDMGRATLWVRPTSAPLNRLEKIPVPYSKDLLNTEMAVDYLEERTMRFVDALNTFYVGITRPRDELYLLVSNTKLPKGGSQDGRLSYLIARALSRMEDTVVGAPLSRADIDASHSGQSVSPTYILDTYPSGFFTPVTPLSYSEEPFSFSAQDSARQWGIVLHKAFSRIQTVADVPQVLEGLVAEGELAGNVRTMERYKKAIALALQDPEAAQWFDGSWKVRNEAAILCAQGAFRPDRVIEKQGKTLVVDYKFGQPRPEHKRQVDRYAALLRQMGYPQVEGHVWYILKEMPEL